MVRNSLATIALLAGSIASGQDVRQLGSDNYKERETATNAFRQKMNPETEEMLLKVQTNDIEVKRRIQSLLGPYYEKQAHIRVKDALKGEAPPWIDVSGDYTAQQTYFPQTPSGPKDGPPDWERHRKATELMLLDLSRQKVDIVPIVEMMRQKHNAWIDMHGKNYNPPLKKYASP